MNLVSSKLLKSNKMGVSKTSQSVQAYSCELYIDSFKIATKGYIHFVWSSSTTQITSLRYESSGKNVSVKETLTISVRIPIKNGKQQPMSTYLKLLAQNEQEIDECELAINSMTAQFKDLEIPMDKGLCVLKIRKKGMKLVDEEDVSPQQSMRMGLYRSRNAKIDEKSSIHSGDYQSLQQQLSRIKKKLQDQEYLNNKLRNDRDVLLSTKQELETEIQNLILQAKKEIKILREHFESRLSIREHTYEEEIENLVNGFNTEGGNSKKIVDIVMKMKIKAEQDLQAVKQKQKAHDNQIATREEQIASLDAKVTRHKELIQKLEPELQEKRKQAEGLSQQLKAYKKQMTEKVSSLEIEIEHLKQVCQGQESEIKKLNQKIQEMDFEIKSKDNEIQFLNDTVRGCKEKEEGNVRQIQLLSKQVQFLEVDKKGLIEQLQGMRAKLQQFQCQMEFNDNSMAQLKKQHQQKEEELYLQLQNLQKVYEKKIEDLLADFKNERSKIDNTSQVIQKEKIQLESRMKDLQNIAEVSQVKIQEKVEEISNLQNQLQTTKKESQEKERSIAHLQAELSKLNQQLQEKKDVTLKKERSQKNLQEQTGVLMKKNEQLDNRNTFLEQEIKKLKEELSRKDTELEEIKAQHKEQGEMQKSLTKKLSLYESVKQVESMQNIPAKTTMEEDIKALLEKKQLQLDDLKRRIDQLQVLYQYLQQRLDKIIEMYPNVDMSKVDATLAVIDRCDSEKQEEMVVNKATSIHNQPLDNLPPEHKPLMNDIGVTTPNGQNNDQISSFQPYSERKIDDFREVAVMKVKVPTPKGSLKKHVSINSSIQENQSGISGTSWVKVSHRKKIQQLENRLKQYQERQKQYLQEINTIRKNKEDGNALRPPFKTLQGKLVNTESQVFFEDERYKAVNEQLKGRQIQLNKKEEEISRKESRIKELEDERNMNNMLRNQMNNKNSQLEQKIAENNINFERREEDWRKKLEDFSNTNKILQKQIAEMEQRLRKQKQAAQEVRLALKELNLHYQNSQNELKKAKNQIQALQEKVRKMEGGELVIRELSKEIEEMGKKNLDQIRTINHLKLEKDSSEEELRLFKKRQNEQSRIASQWEEKAASLERAIEQFKRKQSKLKRQIQDGQQQVRRNKLQQKKLEDEIQALSTAQIGWQVERRKYLDQISNLQDQMSRKDYDIAKLNKQIERWRVKAEEKDDLRLGKKSQLREEIERLQNEMIRKEKKLFEEVEQNKLLRGRLELVEKENKRIMQQRNQTYGQKLRYYVEEMGTIKKLLDQYQTENSRLKVDNNELYQQFEMVRTNYDKLQIRYEEVMEREENIMNDLQTYMDQINSLKEKLNISHNDITQLESAFANLRHEADEEKTRSKKLTEKLETSERSLENSQTQVRELKLKVNEYETNNEINSKVGERYKLLQRRKGELEEECKRLKTDNDNMRNIFTFTRDDLQKAVNDVRTQERRMKQDEIRKMEQDCNKLIISKTQRLEQQLLDVYNENNKIRTDIQVILEENARQKARIVELQILVEKVGLLQGQNENYRTELDQIKEDLRKKNEKIGKTEVVIEGIESESNLKSRQLNSMKGRIAEFEKTIQKLNEEIKARRNTEKDLQEALVKATNHKDKAKTEEDMAYKQKEMQLTQQYQAKISYYEVELQKAKDKEARYIEENNNKMRKLQQKMDEMEEALKQKEKAIEGHYIAEVTQLQNSLFKLSQELKEKLALIDQLNEAIIVLEGDNVDLSKQLQQLNYKETEERQVLQTELNRLKSKFKEAETAYSTNLKTLEDELVKATQLKASNISNSRLKPSDAEERVAKRYQDKLKNKDKKIEELKENIYTLEETILKLKKKESSFQVNLNQLQKMRLIVADYQKEKKKMESEWQSQLSKHAELIREMKKQILRLKQQEEKARLISQEKILENDSLACELKTIRQLYQELQKQLERRKNNLTLQLQEQSSLQYQIRTQENKIAQLEERLLGDIKKTKQYELQDKKKSAELKRNGELIEQLKKAETQYKAQILKLTTELANLRQSLSEYSTSCQSIKSELRFSKSEISRLKKVHEDLRLSNQDKQQTSSELKRINEQLLSRYRDCEEAAKKYSILNERSREELGCSIEQLVQRYSIVIEQKDAETNELIQQIEELKFLNERKYMDYDEMKKLNFELQLKVEEYQSLSDQLQTLRRICDKLEEEKKSSVFKEQVLRMQIQNLGVSASPELKSRIDAILAAPIVPSFTNFSFY